MVQYGNEIIQYGNEIIQYGLFLFQYGEKTIEMEQLRQGIYHIISCFSKHHKKYSASLLHIRIFS